MILNIIIVLLVFFTSLVVCTEPQIIKLSSQRGNNDFFSYFVKEAYKYPMDNNAKYTAESIPWLDEELVKRSVIFTDKNFLGISLASFYGSIDLFAIKSTTSVLMCAGTVKNREASIKRVLRTALHSMSWTNAGTKIFDPDNLAYASISSVRHKHQAIAYQTQNHSAASVEFMDKHVLEPPYKMNWKELRKLADAVRADLKFVDTNEAPIHILDWDTPTTIGQFDLGIVQFLELVHVVMNPEAFGISDGNNADLLAYIHYSAIRGRLLGIQDKFNVALNLPLDMYEKFYRNIVVASLKNIDEHIVHVMDIVMKSMADEFYVPQVFQLRCWLYHSLKNSVDGFKGKHLLALMTFNDRICLNLLDLSVGSINKTRLYKFVGKVAFKDWIQRLVKRYEITFP